MPVSWPELKPGIFRILETYTGTRYFFFSERFRPVLGPTQHEFDAYQVLPLEQPRGEINHSHSPSAEVKNEWISPSTPPICLYVMDRVEFTVSTKQLHCPVGYCSGKALDLHSGGTWLKSLLQHKLS